MNVIPSSYLDERMVGRLLRRRYFTYADGIVGGPGAVNLIAELIYKPADDVRYILFTGVGGGPSGGGADAASSNISLGGGASAANVTQRILARGATRWGTFHFRIGNGAAGTSAANGTGGGNTSILYGISNFLTANTGSNATYMVAGTSLLYLTQIGGNTQAGDLTGLAQTPNRANWSTYGKRHSATVAVSGTGGSCLFGVGGQGRITSGAGNAAVGYGAGGGGALALDGTGPFAGGAGANGLIIAAEYS
jgi:hypothetical protein